MLAVRTPGAPQATRSVAQPAIPPSPLRDRVGYSDHVRFRGYFPVHFIPAYNLPVYASPWPLPDTTQDSVRGCSLGFTAAAISGDGDQRTCKAQLSQNRICGPRVRLFGSLDRNAKTSCSESSTGFNSCHRFVRTQSRPANQDGGYARVIPGWFERNHLPRPENAGKLADRAVDAVLDVRKRKSAFKEISYN